MNMWQQAKWAASRVCLSQAMTHMRDDYLMQVSLLAGTVYGLLSLLQHHSVKCQ